MNDYGRQRGGYLSPPSENLPPESIYNHVKVDTAIKPQPHLMRMFKTYVENEADSTANLPYIDFQEFGSKWLALFNYETHEGDQGLPIMDWVEQVAGSAYRRVRLMRWVNGVYTEVAQIPAMCDNDIQMLANPDRDYFLGMAAYQSIIHRTSGHIPEADGYIERNMTKRVMVERKISERFHEMNDIFKLYGVERKIPDWIKQLDGANSPTPETSTIRQKTVDVIEDGDFEEIDEW